MTGKSIWAVAAGVIFVGVVTTLADIVLHAVHVFPPLDQPIDDKLAVLATSYRIAFGVAGAWLTARLAPNRPMRHVMILGVAGAFVALVGAVATWNLDLGPHWYPIALVVLAIPQSWLGGKIHASQR
jgi:hypothetical protein